MRALVSLFLLIHASLHLLGVAKAWALADVPQLTGRTLVRLPPWGVRTVGALWLTAAVLLGTAVALRLLHRDAWWMVAAAGVVLSQALVFLQWQDAWAGSIANLFIVSAIAVAAGTARFQAESTARAQALLDSVPAGSARSVGPEDLSQLPEPVRRWLERSGVVGQPRARTVRLRQRGGMRTAPGQTPMPAVAEQYFSVTRPGFVWLVNVTMMRVVPIVGRDTFAQGRGRMLIKAGGLVTVADGTGPTFDQGTALRFLGEIVWFPSAALEPFITWTPRDARSADATLVDGDVRVSATFEFDELGRFSRLTADRYYDGRTLERWVIPATEWRIVRGIEMPVRGGAVWKLAEGDFDYYDWEIVDVEVNPRTLWPAER